MPTFLDLPESSFAGSLALILPLVVTSFPGLRKAFLNSSSSSSGAGLSLGGPAFGSGLQGRALRTEV
jgi:hypothetical protein